MTIENGKVKLVFLSITVYLLRSSHFNLRQ